MPVPAPDRRRPAGQVRVAVGEVGLADAGVGGLAQQRRDEREPAPDPAQHAPGQQLLDGALQLDRGDRGRRGRPRRCGVRAALPARRPARCRRRPSRRAAPRGRRRAARRCGRRAPRPGRGRAARRRASRRPGARPAASVGVVRQRAALDQQRDEFGQVERVALGGGEQPVGVGRRQPAAAEVRGEQPGRVGAAQRRQVRHLGVGEPGQRARGADQLRPAEQQHQDRRRRAWTAWRRARRWSPASRRAGRRRSPAAGSPWPARTAARRRRSGPPRRRTSSGVAARHGAGDRPSPIRPGGPPSASAAVSRSIRRAARCPAEPGGEPVQPLLDRRAR